MRFILDRGPDFLTSFPWCVQSGLTRVVKPSEIEICKTANGSDWQLGYGSFGEVRVD